MYTGLMSTTTRCLPTHQVRKAIYRLPNLARLNTLKQLNYLCSTQYYDNVLLRNSMFVRHSLIGEIT